MSAKKATKKTAPKANKKPAAPIMEADAPTKTRKLSALDAAAKVLGEAGTPMNCKQLIETMAAKGYWTTPGGRTPSATLYSAILKEVTTKGKESRFVKVDRGQFGLSASA
jgi:hypothetical protein